MSEKEHMLIYMRDSGISIDDALALRRMSIAQLRQTETTLMPNKRTHVARPVLAVEELATVLAALRYWQRNVMSVAGTYPAEWKIATSDHDHRPLDAKEIDALCERINKS